MPLNPKAESPSMQNILFEEVPESLWTRAAAMAKPRPTPMVPNEPASKRFLGNWFSRKPRPISIVLAPSETIMASLGICSRY